MLRQQAEAHKAAWEAQHGEWERKQSEMLELVKVEAAKAQALAKQNAAQVAQKEEEQAEWEKAQAAQEREQLAAIQRVQEEAEQAIAKSRMGELTAALADLKTRANEPSAHRRVGKALEVLGREEAAKKSFARAEAIEASTVEDQD